MDMSEVTDKIRNAIKEKLKEINAFVDDELPDYIMILVANKRSKHHMEKDLSLFLGKETAEFTNWLWNLVNNFKIGSKSKRSKKDDSKVSEVPPESKENRVDEDDVLNYDPTEEGEFYCTEDKNEPSTKQLAEVNKINSHVSVAILSNDSKVLAATAETDPKFVSCPASPKQVSECKVDGTQKSEDKQMVELPPVAKNTPSATKIVQKSAKVYPVQRVREVSSMNMASPVKTKTRCEYDSLKSENTGVVSSVVCVTQKKQSRPAALQANKILLKAVNDATKSVLGGKDINEYYRPVPVKVPPTDLKETVEMKENKIVWGKANDELAYEINQDLKTVKSCDNLKTLIDLNSCWESEPLSTRQVIHFEADSPMVDEMMSEGSVTHSPSVLNSTQLTETAVTTPHFIVTLDGVSSLKRRHSSVESMDVDEDISIDESLLPNKKQKLQERCKYWPACKNSDNCAYHHPTVPCKCFPHCKFGDKCLYIHPNCKFDSLCSRRDCPYTHCSKRILRVMVKPSVRPVQNTKIVCKYYPKCTAKSCPFIHPKPCRFGVQCRAPKCPFSHFQIPNRDKLKWKASV